MPPLVVFGVAFGALAVQAGLSPWLTLLSSVIVLSGSAQVAMVGLLPAGPGAVLLATAGLGLRHVPMSAALSEMVGKAPWWRRLHLAWVLVDESFGLTLNASRRGEPDLVAYKTAADLTLYSTWLVTTAIGAWLGTSLDPNRLGMDVIFPLVFLALAAPLVHGRRQWITVGVAALAAVAAIVWLPPAWQVTGAALVGAAIGSRFK
ncbi:MAG TPA: AzlC family ABC transporter permease [Acidimicrobiia bacterium]